MIDLDQMEKDANAVVQQLINELANKALADIKQDFADARKRLEIE